MDVVAAVDVAVVVIVVAEEAAVADTRIIETTIIPMGDVDVDLVEVATDEDMVETDVVAVMTIITEDVDSTSRMATATIMMGVVIIAM